jgi:long-chain acyl-CoA synthetase
VSIRAAGSDLSHFYNLGAVVLRESGADPTALIDLGGDGGPRVYTRDELDELGNGAARGLLAQGLRRGDRVAILSANRAEFLITFLGALRAGLVAVPVNFKLPEPVVRQILRDCDARLVVCDEPRAALCPPDVPKLVYGDDGEHGFTRLLRREMFEPVRPTPDEAALFLYTSGSTGQPKGVVLTHAGHLWVLRVRPRRHTAELQRVLVAAPLYHMNALATSLATLSQSNAAIVMLPSFTVQGCIDAIASHRVNVVTAIPTMIAMMLRESDALAHANLSSVEAMRIGSAPVSQALIDATRRYFPRAEIANAYGTTEGGPVVFGPHPDGLPRPAVSVGYPHPEVTLRLVDGDDRDASEGVLQMKCPAVMREYHKLPEATRRAFTADGFYVTGDVMRRDAAGFFHFVGRNDDMFVCGGENIYPGEVEKVLERHPKIQEACVVPIPDVIKGFKPVAFVVCKPGESLTEAEAKQFAIENLALYQHPRRIWFLSELPVAGTNKIDVKALKASAASSMAISEGGTGQ